MNKTELKLLKLQKKAEKCISRKKAVKLMKKYEKTKTALYEPNRSDSTSL